ncbi:MAB_1171c family putative transporter [Streptomyces sp. NPDC096097]|uniref:MAB_1171c family putative transporter n=1 Tax=Streptomyces sp. NPDC096097 TaxID=3155546 RepID=UPI003331EC61
MYTIYQFTLPAMLWAVVIWRAPSAFNGSRPSRYLWGFLTAITVAVTTRAPAVEDLILVATGSPDLSILIKHVAGLASNYFVMEYVITVHGRGPRRAAALRLRIVAVLTAALALTVVFVFFFKHDPTAPAREVTDAHLGDPAVRLYEGIVYVYLGTATLLSAKLFWSNRRSVPRGLLRAGVVCLAAGSALGFVYTFYRVLFFARLGSQAQAVKPGSIDEHISEILPAITLLVLLAGLALPPLRTLVRYLHDQYALWRLHPLWSDLLVAAPTVVFGPRVGRTRDLFVLGDRTLDVAHRAFEIRDACLVLRDRSAEPGPEGAEPACEEPLGGEEPDARAEAAWLFAALHGNFDAGRPPLPSRARSPREEVAWLLKVAAAYRQLSGAQDARVRGREGRHAEPAS